MRKNFAKYEDLQELFADIGKKKLSVSDTMPTAGATYEDICILYIGPTDANYTKGYVYECEEVTPATDPKTYSWNAKINIDVDLSKYKTIFPGTKEEWEALTEAQQDQYDYCFFDGDESDYYAVSDEVTKGDMHPVTSNAVAENIQDMNNVYGSKNLCPTFMSGTIAGVTYTVNLDGSITAVGTSNATTGFGIISDVNLPNGEYIMSAGADASTDLRFIVKIVKGGTANYYEVDSPNKEVSFTVDDPDSLDIYVRTNGGNVSINGTLYPMIRCASISDNTYVPYVPTNRQLLSHADNGILGAKNLLPNIANSKTENGLTFTANSDGSVTVNGTATNNTYFRLDFIDSINNAVFDVRNLIGKPLIASVKDVDSGVAISTGYFKSDGTYGNLETGIRTSREIIYPSDAVKARTFLSVGNGTTINNATVYPMIRLASDSDSNYQPYAKTNKELTEDIATISDELILSGFDSVLNKTVVRQGNIIKLFVDATVGSTDIGAWNTDAITIPNTILPNSPSTYIASIVNGYEVGANNESAPITTYASLGVNKKIGMGMKLAAGKRYIFETIIFLI